MKRKNRATKRTKFSLCFRLLQRVFCLLPGRVRRFAAICVVLVVILGAAACTTTPGQRLLARTMGTSYKVVDTNSPVYATSPVGPEAALSPVSPVFTPEVFYWEPLIKAWAIMYQIDPNLIATVIQIESCGDPWATSPSGAQGLFQVMPFHFEAGEDMLDVQTNAIRGLNYLQTGLQRADGHAGLALAGYNGGHGVIGRGWSQWATETQRYYYWGTRIYAEAISGELTSATLQEWLDAGGAALCSQANQRIKQLEEQQSRALMVSN